VVDLKGQPFTADAKPDMGCYEIQEKMLSLMVIVR